MKISRNHNLQKRRMNEKEIKEDMDEDIEDILLFSSEVEDKTSTKQQDEG